MITLWFLLYVNVNLPADGNHYLMVSVYETKEECLKVVKSATAPGLFCHGQNRSTNDKRRPVIKMNNLSQEQQNEARVSFG